MIALSAMACSKSSAEGASASAKPGASGAPAAAAAEGCVPGAYVHPDPKFCLKVPDKFKPTAPEKVGERLTRVRFEIDKFSAPFNVDWEKGSLADVKGWIDAPANEGDKKEIGDLGKNGRWFVLSFKGGIKQVESFTESNGTLFKCYANVSAEEAGPFIEACKSLRIP
jgi:hypothetical protein